MARLPQRLLRLGFVLSWHWAVVEGFILPSSSTIQSAKISFSYRKRQSIDVGQHSTYRCVALVSGDGDDEFDEHAHNKAMWNTSKTWTNDVDDIWSTEEKPIDVILTELDWRQVRYPPTASRAQLEEVVRKTKPIVAFGKERLDTNARISLKRIIKELDERHICYPPTATRADLEAMLVKSKTGPVSERQSTDESSRDKRMPLKTLLAALDERNIRYSPTATRADLEALLSKSRTGQISKQQTTGESLRDKRIPLKTLLVELDKHNIRYSPTATRADLEVLLSKSRTGQGSALQETGESLLEKHIPLKLLLAELDKRNIQYSSTATRLELEELLQRAPVTDEQRRLQRRRQRQQQLEANEPVKTLFKKSTRVAAKAVQKIPRTVSKIARKMDVTSRLSRRASSFWREDENGIREPEWKYVSRIDTPIDVPAVRVIEIARQTPLSDKSGQPHSRMRQPPRNVARQSPRNQQFPKGERRPRGAPAPGRRSSQVRQPHDWVANPTSGTWQDDSRIPKQSRRNRPSTFENAKESPNGARFILPPSSQDVVAFPDAETPQPRASADHAAYRNATSSYRGERKRRKRPPRGGDTSLNKRIYSPYPQNDDIDTFDRFGNAIADTADRLLWGENDEEIGTRDETKPRHQDHDTKRQKPRHWKDRLAERIDYALGIHEDGEYYNSWEKQLEREKGTPEKLGGPEPWPTRNNWPSKPKYSVPFWEEEGNLMSLLLGKTISSGNKRGDEKYMDFRRGSGDRILTTFFKSLLQSLLLAATYICRWASVRGAVPQPIVVMGVTSAFLSARPKKRHWAVATALVTLRTIGELIHGYVWGDEGWEEDDMADDESEETPSSPESSKDDRQ